MKHTWPNTARCEPGHRAGVALHVSRASSLGFGRLAALHAMKTKKNIAIAITTLLAVVTVGCSKIASRPEAITDALQRKADEFVHERHQKWHERARHVSQVVPGVERTKVL
jgi:hypothetical protein